MLIDREQELEELNFLFFARNGFTEAAQSEAQTTKSILVDLALLDQGLQ